MSRRNAQKEVMMFNDPIVDLETEKTENQTHQSHIASSWMLNFCLNNLVGGFNPVEKY